MINEFEVAAALGVEPWQVYPLACQHRLPLILIGSQRFVANADLAQWREAVASGRD
jgi:hypothetical protein